MLILGSVDYDTSSSAIPLTPQRVAQKANLSFFVNEIQVQSNKVCDKVSLCENFQQKSSSSS